MISAIENNDSDLTCRRACSDNTGNGQGANVHDPLQTSSMFVCYRTKHTRVAGSESVTEIGIGLSPLKIQLGSDLYANDRHMYSPIYYAWCARGWLLENFIRLLTGMSRSKTFTRVPTLRVGRVDPSVPRSKRLLTDDRSNIFVYMTGHGGNEFLKFQDNEEISAFDIADAFEQMWQKKRYNEIFFMIDTCQANTLYSQFYSPNILATGSSEIEENSYSHENDNDIGVSVIDSYTHFVLEFMEGINKTSQVFVQDLFSSYDPAVIRSNAGVRSDLFRRPLDKTRITDFFGGVAQAEVFPPAQESVQGVLPENVRPSETSQHAVIPPENDPITLRYHPDGVRDNTTLPWLGNEREVWDVRWKDIRKWTSVLLIVSLLTWVSFA
ncbi:peptidase C13 family-domain-containing protein, partial [Butyriboletus roseoflavus]